MSDHRDRLAEKLIDRLTGHAYHALSCVRSRLPGGRVVVIAKDAEHRLTLTVEPAAAPAGGPVNVLGQHFSPVEQLVVNALAPDKVMVGKKIAAETGRAYDGAFRVILKNLLDRKVLRKVRADDGRSAGYRLAGLAPRVDRVDRGASTN